MKKMIIGIIIGLMLGLSTTAFAAIGDSVTAVFADFQYVVNGEIKTIDSPALVYEGKSYLPTTQIANLLGNDVTYKADSRTIEFNGPEPTPSPSEPTPTPAPTETPPASPTPDGTAEPTPTPSPSATPEPTASPSPSAEPSPTPSPTPEPTVTPSPSPSATPTPTPTPDNTAACQQIRDEYRVQIGMLPYGPNNDLGHIRYYTLQLEYARDQELAAAGCN